MRRRRSVALVALIGLAVLAGARSPVQAQWWKLAWTLDVKYTQPKRVPVDVPGAGTVLFTYLTYEITNRSLRDVDVVPVVTMVTDTFQTYYNVNQPDVKTIAERRERKALLTPLEMVGPLKIGESRSGVIIFRDVDLKAKRWHIYFAGLSGEYVLQLIPGQAEPLILHKAFHLEYRNRGDGFRPRDEEIEFVQAEWTYR